jgi:hypothetical protein
MVGIFLKKIITLMIISSVVIMIRVYQIKGQKFSMFMRFFLIGIIFPRLMRINISFVRIIHVVILRYV